MNEQQAEKEIRARVRDFAWWAGANPAARPEPADGAALEEKAAFLRAMLPIIGKNDPDTWQPGGWKRVELDEAFSVLGLAPLGWEG